MSDIVIEVENVSKLFKLYHNPITGPVKEVLFPWRRDKYYESFWAVNDVNMQVQRGEVVGIVGPNGAGKTTLLKMIAGLLPVDKGRITVRGKITALLALGVGVHPEFSGRENILYGAMLLGMTKREVLNKMEEIIEFAELGEFINRPFRTYSSGMKARLLFAISMSIEPDILIVDEALATGDSYFLAKSRNKILELCNSGATILFVSHNLSQVSELCSRAYFMAEGSLRQEGSSQKAIYSYNNWVFNRDKELCIPNDTDLIPVSGTKNILIDKVALCNEDGVESNGFVTGSTMKIRLHCISRYEEDIKCKLFIGFLKQPGNKFVGELYSDKKYYEDAIAKNINEEVFVTTKSIIEIELSPLLLLGGNYSLWIYMYRVVDDMVSGTECEYKSVAPFVVRRKNDATMKDAVFFHPFSCSRERL